MKKILMILMAVFMVTVEAKAAVILDYADNQPEGYPTVLAAKEFARIVEKGTNGRIKVVVHANAKLATEETIVKQMRYGTVDITRISVPYLANAIREFQVFQLPYLFRNSEHMWKVLDGEIGDRFLRLTNNHDLVAISWFDAGARNFYTTKKPIKTLSDFAGCKIRTQTSEISLETVRRLGAEPMPISYDKVYGALLTSEIDGAENNWSSYVAMGHNEAAKFVTETRHNYLPELQVISKEALKELQDLSPADKQVVLDAAKASAKYERGLWKKYEDDAKRKAIANGTTVVKLSAGELAKIKAALAPLEKAFMQSEQNIIKEIRKVQ
ncbi:MAG: TRAP transporter substrate-binding protein [Selenomonadaceae bacterium]|nr:TRAP transporter substrate-binding protein [Selenomonadaceae bacterium]